MLPTIVKSQSSFATLFYPRQTHLSKLCKGCLFQGKPSPFFQSVQGMPFPRRPETRNYFWNFWWAGGFVWKLGTHTREGRKARKSYVCVSVYGMVFASTFLLRGSPAPNGQHSPFTQSRSGFYFIMRSGRIRFLLSHDSDDEDRWHPVVRLGPGDGGRPAFLFFSSVHH